LSIGHDHPDLPRHSRSPSEVRSARSQGAGGGGFSGTISGGFLISGSSSSSSDRLISGASGGGGGFLIMIGSPGGRPGALGTGSGIGVSLLGPWTLGQRTPLSTRSPASACLPQAAWRSDNLHIRRWSATLEIMVRSNPLATEPEAGALSSWPPDGALRDRTASGLS
jgi:hypothetical protein